jgi:Tol biopolymer transport system component
MFDSSKRKNDDKAKGLPRRRIVMIALVTLVVGTIAAVALRFIDDPATDLSGHLFYVSGPNNYDLNMRTGERVSINPADRPKMSVHDWQPISPDGKWRAQWDERTSVDLSTYGTISLTNMADSLSFDVAPPDMFEGGSKILTWTPDSQSIIFVANPKGMPGYSGSEMWRINIVTTQLERLTNNTFAEMWPAVSPDGTKIGYVATPDGYRRLYVMDVATGATQLLTPDMFVYFPVWSPDSQWLAFMTDHTGSGDIWIVRADGSESRPIAITSENEREPVWKP